MVLQYRTINVYRSAISAYHKQIDNKPVPRTPNTEHPDVCALLAGINNIRPSIPRYSVIWEIEPVIKFLRDMGNDEALSDKDITLKTAMLLALTAIKG